MAVLRSGPPAGPCRPGAATAARGRRGGAGSCPRGAQIPGPDRAGAASLPDGRGRWAPGPGPQGRASPARAPPEHGAAPLSPGAARGGGGGAADRRDPWRHARGPIRAPDRSRSGVSLAGLPDGQPSRRARPGTAAMGGPRAAARRSHCSTRWPGRRERGPIAAPRRCLGGDRRSGGIVTTPWAYVALTPHCVGEVETHRDGWLPYGASLNHSPPRPDHWHPAGGVPVRGAGGGQRTAGDTAREED